MLKIQFLGATGTVTGSKYSITYGNQHILVDFGLFQGEDAITARNWDALPVAAEHYQALVVTHAHIDHVGAIPRLVASGFHGPIQCTEPTLDFCEILLPDSGRIQEQKAGQEAPPFYTEDDAYKALKLFEAYPYYQSTPVIEGVRVTFQDAGHILGSAWLEMVFEPLASWPEQRPVRVVFSGDIGRGIDSMLMQPDRPQKADFLILESTYGDQLHPETSPREQLARLVRVICRERTTLVIPAFAVQRSQDLVFLMEELRLAGDIQPVSTFLDSPMAVRATRIFEEYPDYLSHESGTKLKESGRLLSYPYLRMCESASQSRAIHDFQAPRIIISASGMLEGGRVLHHLRRHLPQPRDHILLSGYQCEGTRGYLLENGASSLDIDGRTIPVRAHVQSLEGFSGHADYSEIEDWLSDLEGPPGQTFLVHGEEEALQAQCLRLSQELGWNVHVPEHRQEFVLVDEL